MLSDRFKIDAIRKLDNMDSKELLDTLKEIGSVPVKVTAKNINDVKEAIKAYEDKFNMIHQLTACLDYLCEADEFVFTYENAPIKATLKGEFLEYIKQLIMGDIDVLKRDIEYEDHN